MPQYVAFIRAVNVAGHARVTMTNVQEAFATSGCQNAQTIIQSGNVLFECPRRACADTMRAVARRLRVVLGEEPQIVLRTVRQIADIIERAPFAGYELTPRVKFYVAFLAGTPRRLPPFPVSNSKEMLEAIAIVDREVFIVSRLKKNGFFGFPNNFIEDELAVAATTRNWSTVTKIVQIARERAAAGRQRAAR
jgi:uncharacterized protein (DUF1697 family)